MSDTAASENVPLRDRIRERPRPALLWGSVLAVLVALEFGALASATVELLGAIVSTVGGPVEALSGLRAAAESIPTLLSRETIPNQGYFNPNANPGLQGWENTFLGLEPKWPWALRALLIFAYTYFFVYWLWRGYKLYQRHYRQADWTPRDDIVRRLEGHRWGQFGFVIVLAFLTMAMFAPALGPTTVDRNIANPCSHQVQYWSQQAGGVQTMDVCDANFKAASNGRGEQNIGPFQYDRFGRYHPFGTTPTPGKDLFTFMMAGARVSLFIGLLAIGLGGVVAAAFAMLTAYYKGLTDLAVVIASDSIMTIPQLLLLIIVSVTFRDHWLNQVYSGGLLIALILAFTSWPLLWRAIRGPAFQVSEKEWVDAARSYGQRASVTMRKHMLPYVIGYLLIYGSMSLGGVIITTSALSFLPGGLGVQAPTPEWGRAIAMGQNYVATPSWHISLIPGIMIVLVVTAFNALGDGIRDALDPQSEGGDTGAEVAAGGGG